MPDQGIMHRLGSKLVDIFVVSIAVFAVHITEAFSLHIPPFNRCKVAIQLAMFVSAWIKSFANGELASDYIFTQWNELFIKIKRITGNLQWHEHTHICIKTVTCHPFIPS